MKGATESKFHWTSIGEILFFLLVTIGLNVTLYANSPGFLNVSPHPYLLIIVLMAGYYGFREGAASAAIVSAALVIQASLDMNKPVQSVMSSPEILKMLLIFFGTAFVLGELKGVHDRRHSQLKKSLDGSRKSLEVLESIHKAVVKAKEELEDRILRQDQTLNSIYKAFQKMEGIRPMEKVYGALLDILVNSLDVEQCSLFLYDGSKDRFLLRANRGGNGRAILSTASDSEQEVFQEVLRKGRVATLKDLKEDASLSSKSRSYSLIYAPVVADEKAPAIITVERMPFAKLNLSAVRTLSVIADLAVHFIRNVFLYGDGGALTIKDPLTGVCVYEYFQERFKEEFNRAVRYKLTFSNMVLELTNLKECSQELSGSDEIILSAVANILKKELRSVDIISRGKANAQFAILLPLTDVYGAYVVAEKLRNILGIPLELKGQKCELSCCFGLSGYVQGTEDWGVILEKAYKALRAAKFSGQSGVEIAMAKVEL